MSPIHDEVLLALITVASGIPLGLLIRSASEAKGGGRDPYWISFGGPLGLIFSIVINAILGVLLLSILLFVPRWIALHFLVLPTESNDTRGMWGMLFLVGAGLGKWFRWLRWRRDRDFG